MAKLPEQKSGSIWKSLSAGYAPTFYSNAEHAVEQVKQEKAKAEQRKAMLTKAGLVAYSF